MTRGVVNRAVVARLAPHAGLQDHAQVRVGSGDRIRHRDAERGARGIQPADAIVEIEAAVRQLDDVGRPERIAAHPVERLPEFRLRVRHEQIALRRVGVGGDLRPAQPVGRAGRREVRSEHVEVRTGPDDGRVVDGDVREHRNGKPRGAGGDGDRGGDGQQCDRQHSPPSRPFPYEEASVVGRVVGSVGCSSWRWAMEWGLQVVSKPQGPAEAGCHLRF